MFTFQYAIKNKGDRTDRFRNHVFQKKILLIRKTWKFHQKCILSPKQTTAQTKGAALDSGK